MPGISRKFLSRRKDGMPKPSLLRQEFNEVRAGLVWVELGLKGWIQECQGNGEKINPEGEKRFWTWKRIFFCCHIGILVEFIHSQISSSQSLMLLSPNPKSWLLPWCEGFQCWHWRGPGREGGNNGATPGMWKHPKLYKRGLKLWGKEPGALQEAKQFQWEPARENHGKKKFYLSCKLRELGNNKNFTKTFLIMGIFWEYSKETERKKK